MTGSGDDNERENGSIYAYLEALMWTICTSLGDKINLFRCKMNMTIVLSNGIKLRRSLG